MDMQIVCWSRDDLQQENSSIYVGFNSLFFLILQTDNGFKKSQEKVSMAEM